MSSPKSLNYYEDCPVRPEALLLFGERSAPEKLAEFRADEARGKTKQVFKYYKGRKVK